MRQSQLSKIITTPSLVSEIVRKWLMNQTYSAQINKLTGREGYDLCPKSVHYFVSFCIECSSVSFVFFLFSAYVHYATPFYMAVMMNRFQYISQGEGSVCSLGFGHCFELPFLFFFKLQPPLKVTPGCDQHLIIWWENGPNQPRDKKPKSRFIKSKYLFRAGHNLCRPIIAKHV